MVERQGSKYAILGMLSLRPMSGYDTRKTVQESIRFFWSESYGQIYPALKRLEAQKLVERAG
jgi:PadR family transcriptional regulator, regulatory protein AphA